MVVNTENCVNTVSFQNKLDQYGGIVTVMVLAHHERSARSTDEAKTGRQSRSGPTGPSH